MTERAPVHLGFGEPYSLFVPTYGFQDVYEAGVYSAAPNFCSDNGIFGIDDAFAAIRTSHKTYVPRMSAGYGRWLTTPVLTDSALSGTLWQTLRALNTPLPPTAYNVVLVLEGKRQFWRDTPRRRNKFPSWWYSLSTGRRDCYAVWARSDGKELDSPVLSQQGVSVYAVRSGVGAIYSRERVFAANGKDLGVRLQLAIVNFSVLDKNPEKGDALRVIISRRFCFAGEMDLEGLDEQSAGLAKRAIDGFNQHCSDVPEGALEIRDFFLAQNGALAEDGLRGGDSFRARISGLPWQSALEQVTEPWHLKVVVDVHCGQQFDECTQRFSPHYERVARMLAQHECSAERRAELQGFVSAYVAPTDKLWNYTGD